MKSIQTNSLKIADAKLAITKAYRLKESEEPGYDPTEDELQQAVAEAVGRAPGDPLDVGCIFRLNQHGMDARLHAQLHLLITKER